MTLPEQSYCLQTDTSLTPLCLPRGRGPSDFLIKKIKEGFMNEAREATLRDVPASVSSHALQKDLLPFRSRDSPCTIVASNLSGDAIPQATMVVGAKGKEPQR